MDDLEALEKAQAEALAFVRLLMCAPIERIAIENPVGLISSAVRRPDQVLQPWMFGHGETKATCLWLKNLPPLLPTCISQGNEHRVHRMAPSKHRARERSRTYTGIAEAMATQWYLEPATLAVCNHKQAQCFDCRGTGWAPGTTVAPCPTCDGVGIVDGPGD